MTEKMDPVCMICHSIVGGFVPDFSYVTTIYLCGDHRVVFAIVASLLNMQQKLLIPNLAYGKPIPHEPM